MGLFAVALQWVVERGLVRDGVRGTCVGVESGVRGREGGGEREMVYLGGANINEHERTSVCVCTACMRLT